VQVNKGDVAVLHWVLWGLSMNIEEGRQVTKRAFKAMYICTLIDPLRVGWKRFPLPWLRGIIPLWLEDSNKRQQEQNVAPRPCRHFFEDPFDPPENVQTTRWREQRPRILFAGIDTFFPWLTEPLWAQP